MATVPTAPGPFIISSYTDTRVNGDADANSTGGATILEWQLAWGTKPTVADFTGDLNADGSGFVEGLVPGVTYYFWNRQRNAFGWSDLSNRTQVTMRRKPDTPKTPVVVAKTQTTAKVFLAPNSNGGSPLTSYELAYGLFASGSGVSVEGTNSTFLLTGLEAGRVYYFWGRVKNAYGISDWSVRGTTRLIAGAWVKVGPTWRHAVPYVRVAGIWRMAQPWVRSSGEWHETPD